MIEMTDEEFQTVYDGLEAVFSPHDAYDPAVVGHIVLMENKAWEIARAVKSRAAQPA